MTTIYNNLPFQLKAILLVAVLASFTVAAGIRYHILVEEMRIASAKQSTDIMLSGHKRELKDVVDMMAVSLGSAVEGIRSKKQIQSVFSKLVKDARFFPDGSGYMFIYEVGGTVFVHPVKPQLEGRNLSKLKDANGKLLIQELDRVAQAGGGYVDYLWDKPGQGLTPKLSYVRMMPGDRYWIGTGVYIDDVDREKEQILASTNEYTQAFLKTLYIAIGAGAIFLALPLTVFMIRSIIKPMRELTSSAEDFSRGKMDIEIPYTDRKDEIGKLALALKRLGMSVKVAILNMK